MAPQFHSYTLRNLALFLWFTINAIKCENITDGIRCLDCHEVVTPSDCAQWVTCGENEVCYVREFYNRNMERGYHMGCEVKSRCDLYNRMAALLGKRASPNCFQCCSKDDCNADLCATGLSHVGQNAHLRCLDCHSVTDPRMCDKWSRCGEDEVCFTRAFVDSTGQQMFRLGCEFKQICANPSSTNGSTPDPRQCMECCENMDCNSQLCKATLGYTAPTSPAHTYNITSNGCPPSFIRGDNSCYYSSNATQAWEAARAACEKLGAELASIDTQREEDVVENILNNTALAKATGIWIGGFYVMTTNDWHWMNLQPLNFTKWGPSQPTKSRSYYWYSYRLAILNPEKNSGYSQWSWASVYYTTRYNYLCETGAM